MKLDVERIEGSSTPPQYSQMAANQIGQLMEVLGIKHMGVDLARGPSTTVVVVKEISPLDFVPPKLTAVAIGSAESLAKVMASVGISKLTISEVSRDERESLESAWRRSGVGEEDPNSRLAAPPDMNPDMQPVEVEL